MWRAPVAIRGSFACGVETVESLRRCLEPFFFRSLLHLWLSMIQIFTAINMNVQHKLRLKAPNAHTCQLKRRRVCDRISAGKRAGRHMPVAAMVNSRKTVQNPKFEMHCVTVRPWAANRTPANGPLSISKVLSICLQTSKEFPRWACLPPCAPERWWLFWEPSNVPLEAEARTQAEINYRPFFLILFLLFLCAESWKTPLKEK